MPKLKLLVSWVCKNLQSAVKRRGDATQCKHAAFPASSKIVANSEWAHTKFILTSNMFSLHYFQSNVGFPHDLWIIVFCSAETNSSSSSSSSASCVVVSKRQRERETDTFMGACSDDLKPAAIASGGGSQHPHEHNGFLLVWPQRLHWMSWHSCFCV